jgi:4-hydroxybenzoate polyprenyltransferase
MSAGTGSPATPRSLRRRPADGWRRLARACWRTLLAADRFVRLHFLCFSTWLVLLGAASTAARPDPAAVAGLLAVALCFHVYSYVQNDVVDLPVDRTQPSRARDPLVTGALRPWQALALALAQVPLALALDLWLGGGIGGAAVLIAGFALMAVYNLWGKRCFLPPLTDAAQGLAWGSLALFGAIVAPGPPTLLTAVVCGSGAGFILLINGVHGGLRDLDNDLAAGKKTTSIFFGARPQAGSAILVPAGLRAFAWSVQLGLVALWLLPFPGNAFGYGTATWWTALAAALLLSAVNVRYMAWVFRPEHPAWGSRFRVHMFFLLLAPLAVFAPSLGAGYAALVFFCYLAPFVLFEACRDLIRSASRL